MATPSSTSLVKNIYVQLLPIIKRKLKRDEIEQGKILLVKWTHGNFQNRFTGMIKATEFQVDTHTTVKSMKK
jgi:TusA-related sulfurtransferase